MKYYRKVPNEMVVYRLIPHRSVSNNTNRRMWKMLHKMYEIYDDNRNRRDYRFRGGFRITQREKDTLWFDVVFRRVDGEKKAEFYASTTKVWAKKFREILEDRMKVTIEEVDLSALQIPVEDTVVYDVRYDNHDIFSLNTNASEQTTPISSLLSSLDDISEDGDIARLSVCTETMRKDKWIKEAAYYRNKLKKGVIPRRARLDKAFVISGLTNAITAIVKEIFDIIADTMNAITSSFFGKKNGKYESKSLEVGMRNLADVISGNEKNSTINKQYDAVWKTNIRVAAHAKDKLRRELIGNTMAGALSELDENNSLSPIKIRFRARKRVIEEMNTLQLSHKTKMNGDVNRISCDEMAKLALQMPTREIQERYENELTVNKKVETEIPSAFRSDGLLIGHAERKGESVPITLPTKKANEFYRGYIFLGEMGMGKDTAIQNFVVEGCLNHGNSFVVIDQVNKEGIEGMANGIRDSLPSDKIIDLDLSNDDYVPPLDLTEVMQKLGRKSTDRFANELIDFFGLQDMAQSKSIIQTAAKASGGSLLKTKRIIEDDEYRHDIIEEMENDADSDKLVALELKRWGEKLAKNKADPIISRLLDFFGDSTLNQIFSQPPNDEMNFEKWMSEGKVIIIRVPDRVLSTVAVQTLVHWITLKVLMTRLLMANDKQSNGTFMVFNEPQTYLTPGLSKLMARVATQGRKERLGALIAVQYYDQLGSLTKDFSGGGVNWVLFRNGDDTIYKTLRSKLEPHIAIEDAMNTEKYHAINIMTFNGNPQPPFLAKMLPPSYDRYGLHDNSHLTKEHAEKYGRHWKSVNKFIYDMELERERRKDEKNSERKS